MWSPIALLGEHHDFSPHPSSAATQAYIPRQPIGPEAAWDDGAQTWLRFAPGQDLPTVYFVDPDGNEVITNRHMDGDRTIVLQRTASRWHLRLGQKVLAIHNDGRTTTRTLPTGTVSPTVERVLREEPLP